MVYDLLSSGVPKSDTFVDSKINVTRTKEQNECARVRERDNNLGVKVQYLQVKSMNQNFFFLFLSFL